MATSYIANLAGLNTAGCVLVASFPGFQLFSSDDKSLGRPGYETSVLVAQF